MILHCFEANLIVSCLELLHRRALHGPNWLILVGFARSRSMSMRTLKWVRFAGEPKTWRWNSALWTAECCAARTAVVTAM